MALGIKILQNDDLSRCLLTRIEQKHISPHILLSSYLSNIVLEYPPMTVQCVINHVLCFVSGYLC